MENKIQKIDLWGDQPPSSAHQQVLQDDHRFIVLIAGRKFRKTSIGVAKLIKAAMTTPLTYPYLAPFRKQGKEVIWHDHIPRILRILDKVGFPYKKNDSDLTITFPITGGRFKVDGSDNEQALRGIGNWGGMVLSEYADWKEDIWIPIIRPNIMTTKAWVLFEGTPRGFNHFHKMAKLGDHSNVIENGGYNTDIVSDPQFMTYRFTSYDNPYLDKEEIEAARAISTPEYFAQEYLGQFTKHTGLVHKGFSRATHLIDDFAIPHEWRRVRGWDFGASHPTASIRIAIDKDDNFFVEYCYKQKDKSIEEHARFIKTQDYDFGSIEGFADPSGKQWIHEFNLKGLNLRAAKREENTSGINWLQLAIDKINEKLQPNEGRTLILPNSKVIENAPSLFILNRTENIPLLEELETLSFRDSPSGQNDSLIDDTKDRDGHYDLHAALRYAILSYKHNFSWFPVETPESLPQSYWIQKDAEAKAMLHDPEKLRQLEKEADLQLMREAVQRARNEFW